MEKIYGLNPNTNTIYLQTTTDCGPTERHLYSLFFDFSSKPLQVNVINNDNLKRLEQDNKKGVWDMNSLIIDQHWEFLTLQFEGNGQFLNPQDSDEDEEQQMNEVVPRIELLESYTNEDENTISVTDTRRQLASLHFTQTKVISQN